MRQLLLTLYGGSDNVIDRRSNIYYVRKIAVNVDIAQRLAELQLEERRAEGAEARLAATLPPAEHSWKVGPYRFTIDREPVDIRHGL